MTNAIKVDTKPRAAEADIDEGDGLPGDGLVTDSFVATL
jgi:hypothetical protein